MIIKYALHKQLDRSIDQMSVSSEPICNKELQPEGIIYLLEYYIMRTMVALSNFKNLTKSFDYFTEQMDPKGYLTLWSSQNMELGTKLPSKIHLCLGSTLLISRNK